MLLSGRAPAVDAAMCTRPRAAQQHKKSRSGVFVRGLAGINMFPAAHNVGSPEAQAFGVPLTKGKQFI